APRRLGREHPAEQLERARLVEHVVQVAALRRLDARRTAVLAGAALDHIRGVSPPALASLEAARGDSDATGMAVVDEDRRAAGLEVDVGRETADVPAVAHRP